MILALCLAFAVVPSGQDTKCFRCAMVITLPEGSLSALHSPLLMMPYPVLVLPASKYLHLQIEQLQLQIDKCPLILTPDKMLRSRSGK